MIENSLIGHIIVFFIMFLVFLVHELIRYWE